MFNINVSSKNGNVVGLSLVIVILIKGIIDATELSHIIFMGSILLFCITKLIENIFSMMNNDHLAKVFKKITSLNWSLCLFTIAGFACYGGINGKGTYLFFISIPFWLFGIYNIYKTFFKKEDEKTKEQEELKNKIRLLKMAVILVIVCFIIGIVMTLSGIIGNIKQTKTTQNYVTTDSYFDSYYVYDVNEENENLYKLIYIYKVDGKEYTVETKGGSTVLPEKGSIKKVKYNANHPADAILDEPNPWIGLIGFGLFSILILSIFIVPSRIQKRFKKVKIDIFTIYTGIVFAIMGILIMWISTEMNGSLENAINDLGSWIGIPILFIVAGSLIAISGLFPKKKRKRKRY